MTFEDVGDVSDVTRPNFAEYAFNNPDNSDDPVTLFVQVVLRKTNKQKGKSTPRRHRLCLSRNGDDHTEHAM